MCGGEGYLCNKRYIKCEAGGKMVVDLALGAREELSGATPQAQLPLPCGQRFYAHLLGGSLLGQPINYHKYGELVLATAGLQVRRGESWHKSNIPRATFSNSSLSAP
jgi:hypothetical protein